MATKEITWTSAAPGARAKKLSELDDQHLSNILWFSEVFNGMTRDNSEVHFLMGLELARRKIERLPWRPLPVLRGVQELKAMRMINSKGDIIKLKHSDGGRTHYHETIGSIAHIEGWKSM